MALKTFNLDAEAYKEYCKYCKKEGISMSKKIDNFIKSELDKLKHSQSITNNSSNSPPSNHSFSKYC